MASTAQLARKTVQEQSTLEHPPFLACQKTPVRLKRRSTLQNAVTSSMQQQFCRGSLGTLPLARRGRSSPSHVTSRQVVAASPPSTPEAFRRKSVIQLIAANVELNAAVGKFEIIAGRSAMIGFAVAVAAEAFTPAKGLFGRYSNHDLELFGALALGLISCSASLAAMSTRKLGFKLQEAVFTSMTAIARSQGAITNGPVVDDAVDYVLAEVFNNGMVQGSLVNDEFL